MYAFEIVYPTHSDEKMSFSVENTLISNCSWSYKRNIPTIPEASSYFLFFPFFFFLLINIHVLPKWFNINKRRNAIKSSGKSHQIKLHCKWIDNEIKSRTCISIWIKCVSLSGNAKTLNTCSIYNKSEYWVSKSKTLFIISYIYI